MLFLRLLENRMQNALDWASRPKPNNEWQGKPAAAFSVAGGYGGINGLQALAHSSERY